MEIAVTQILNGRKWGWKNRILSHNKWLWKIMYEGNKIKKKQSMHRQIKWKKMRDKKIKDKKKRTEPE